MKPRNTLILALIAGLVGGAIYFFDYWRGEKQAKQEEESKKILAGSWDKVSEVKLATKEAGSLGEIVLRKGGDGAWAIAKPIEAEADQSAVDSIVNELKNLKSDGVASESAEGEALKTFGLETPTATVTASFAEGAGSPVTLRVGDKTPVGYKTYVQKEGDPKVYMAGAYLGTAMAKKLPDLREKRVFVFERKDLKSFTLEYPDRKLALKKEGEKWLLTEPIQAPADSSAVDRLLGLLTGLRAQDFEIEDTADLGPYGLVSPQLKVTLDVGEGDAAVKTFLLGGPTEKDKEKLYAKRAEKKPVFTIRGSTLKDLTKDPGELRDKKVLAFERADVQAVEVVNASGKIRIEKGEGDKWVLKEPEAAEADQSTVNQMLITLKGLEAKEFVDSNPPPLADVGLDPAEITVAVYGKEGAKLADLAVGKEKEKDRHWVKNLQAASITVVDSKFLQDIPKGAAGVKKKEEKAAPEGAPGAGGRKGTFAPAVEAGEGAPPPPH